MPDSTVIHASSDLKTTHARSTDSLDGICGAAAVELLTRKFGVAAEVDDLAGSHGSARTLGDVANQLENLGLSCVFTDELDAAEIVSLPRDTCVLSGAAT